MEITKKALELSAKSLFVKGGTITPKEAQKQLEARIKWQMILDPSDESITNMDGDFEIIEHKGVNSCVVNFYTKNDAPPVVSDCADVDYVAYTWATMKDSNINILTSFKLLEEVE